MVKYILILVLLCSTNTVKAQKVEPFAKFAIYSRSVTLKEISTGTVKIDKLYYSINTKFDHDITIGIKIKHKGFYLKGFSTTSAATDNFLVNEPYASAYTIAIGYEYKGWRVQVEHMCLHSIDSPDLGRAFKIGGGHDMFSISYGM